MPRRERAERPSTGHPDTPVPTGPPSLPAWLSEGLLVALATLSGYSVTLSYHRGVASYFGTPESLIAVTPEATFSSILFVGTSLFALAVLAAAWHLWTGPLPFADRLQAHPVGRTIAEIALPGLIAIATFTGFAGLDPEARLLHAVLASLPPVAMIVAERAAERVGPEGFPRPRAMFVAVLGSALVLWDYLGSYAVGVEVARERRTFYVLEGEPEQVVLAAYGDTLVCAPLDRARRRFQPVYRIRKLADPGGPTLVRERLGPLAMDPPPKPKDADLRRLRAASGRPATQRRPAITPPLSEAA